MSHKMTSGLAAAATLAMAMLTSQSADAGFHAIAGNSPIGGSGFVEPLPHGPMTAESRRSNQSRSVQPTPEHGAF
jgi:hypothetical protein